MLEDRKDQYFWLSDKEKCLILRLRNSMLCCIASVDKMCSSLKSELYFPRCICVKELIS